jgi:hypothetical protein
VDEIFPMDDRADPRDYYFRQLTGADEIEGLIAVLGRHANGEHWEYESWLRRSHEQNKIIVEVKQEGDAEPAGFAVFAARVTIEDHGDEEPEPKLYLTLDLAAVYVSPHRRNSGFRVRFHGPSATTSTRSLKNCKISPRPINHRYARASSYSYRERRSPQGALAISRTRWRK